MAAAGLMPISVAVLLNCLRCHCRQKQHATAKTTPQRYTALTSTSPLHTPCALLAAHALADRS
jgi:hypothetical protein